MKLLLAPSNEAGVGILVKARVVSSSLCVLCCRKLPSNWSQRPHELKVNVRDGADCWLKGSGCCSGCVCYYKEHLVFDSCRLPGGRWQSAPGCVLHIKAKESVKSHAN